MLYNNRHMERNYHIDMSIQNKATTSGHRIQ